ncbi:MAG: hypothetical protein P4L69_08345 [Desulfosporosinus sp.]|nr:hypothetical protein [Desulfosporosinus sp.]
MEQLIEENKRLKEIVAEKQKLIDSIGADYLSCIKERRLLHDEFMKLKDKTRSLLVDLKVMNGMMCGEPEIIRRQAWTEPWQCDLCKKLD